MVEESVMEIIKEYCTNLKIIGIEIDKIVLYGSYAKRKPRLDSDIDVAVISKYFGKDRVEEGMMLFRLAGDVDPRIEPVAISLESYNKDTWIPLIYEIRKNGIEIPIE